LIVNGYVLYDVLSSFKVQTIYDCILMNYVIKVEFHYTT